MSTTEAIAMHDFPQAMVSFQQSYLFYTDTVFYHPALISIRMIRRFYYGCLGRRSRPKHPQKIPYPELVVKHIGCKK
jgi:hypothetical protein